MALTYREVARKRVEARLAGFPESLIQAGWEALDLLRVTGGTGAQPEHKAVDAGL